MNPVSRGIRNAFRNTIRTFSIVVILGLSVALAISMMLARGAVETKIQSVKNSVGTTINVSPAGIQGFQGGGELLTSAQIDSVKSVSNVTDVTKTLSDRATSDSSNLVSAIDAGSFGVRASGNSGVSIEAGPPAGGGAAIGGETGGANFTRSFTPPVIITGTNSLNDTSLFGGKTLSLSSGTTFDATKSENVAIVGKALAEKNNLSVGSTFKLYNTDIKVVGIYDTGTTFTNAGLVMPIATLQTLSSQTGSVSSATVTVASIDNVDAATTAIKDKLGTAADVTNSQDSVAESIKPLESVKTISTFTVIGALVAGAAIILLTMTMIVRERRREIGVLKAIGASNGKTVLQFVAEAITLTTLALLVGLGIGIVAANPITNALVTNSSSSSTSATAITGPGGGGAIQVTRTSSGGGAPGGATFRRIGNAGSANIKNIKTNVGFDVIAYGIAAALAIALIGSAIPAYLISKIRPADVMRAE